MTPAVTHRPAVLATMLILVGMLAAATAEDHSSAVSRLAENAVQAQPQGATLYREHCEGCHNTAGEGGIGVALQPQKLALLPDRYIKQSIRLGRPGRLMPAYDDTLKNKEINAIVGYVRALSGRPAPKIADAPVRGDTKRGKMLYTDQCASCHENSGRGSGLGTGLALSRDKAFPVMPVALNNEGFQDSIRDAELLHIISANHGADPNSPDSVDICEHTTVEPNAAQHLVAYIRSLRTPAKIHAQSGESPVFSVKSPYDLDTTVNNLRAAIAGNNYRVFPNRYLDEGLEEFGEVDTGQVMVRFCNFSDFYELLKVDPRVGLALPCTITALETLDGVKLVAPNPAQLAPMFNNDELIEFSERISASIQAILEEAIF